MVGLGRRRTFPRRRAGFLRNVHDTGAGGHVIAVVPDLDLVVVHRVNTFEDNDIPYSKIGGLLNKIVDANSDLEGTPGV